jgi:hypothetical protein
MHTCALALACFNRRLQIWRKTRPQLFIVYLLAVMVVQQWNYIVYNLAGVVQQCNHFVALLLPTNKQPTIVGVALSISEVVYCYKK